MSPNNLLSSLYARIAETFQSIYNEVLLKSFTMTLTLQNLQEGAKQNSSLKSQQDQLEKVYYM